MGRRGLRVTDSCDRHAQTTRLRYVNFIFIVTVMFAMHIIRFIATVTVVNGFVYHVNQTDASIAVDGAQLTVDRRELDILTQLPVTLHHKVHLAIVNVQGVVFAPATGGLEALLPAQTLPADMVLAGGFRGGVGLT